QFWADEVVRVTFAAGTELPPIQSLAVVATPTEVKWTRQENDQSSTLLGPRFKVNVDKRSGVVTFLDSADKVLLRESTEGRKIAAATQPGVKGDSCAQSFVLPADEGIYGL